MTAIPPGETIGAVKWLGGAFPSLKEHLISVTALSIITVSTALQGYKGTLFVGSCDCALKGLVHSTGLAASYLIAELLSPSSHRKIQQVRVDAA